MELKELGHVELGRFQDLRLSDVHVLERVDASARLLNLSPNRLGHKLLYQLFQVTARRLLSHNLKHLPPDLSNLRRLCIRRLAHLRLPPLREPDREETKEVPVGRLDIDVRLDEGLPFADEGAELVRGKVHAVEVGQAVLALDLVNTELDLAERLLLILVQVAERELDDAALEGVVGVLCKIFALKRAHHARQ